MKIPVLFFVIITIALSPASIRAARKTVEPQPIETKGSRLSTTSTPVTAGIVNQVLGEWDFEDGSGGPDPQGWTMHDLTAQAGPFTHVDDFAGLGGGAYTPLQGAKSLWCGLRPGPCEYATLPGYGNFWGDRFESDPLATSGNVIVDFNIRYDTEPGYDYVRLEYRSISNVWRNASEFTGNGETFATANIPADSLAGVARLRFRFFSDPVYSDEDGNYPTNGAFILDNLRVRDATGTVDFQDFELEAVGAQTTIDGAWAATVPPPYGNYAGLVDGTTVLQQDPVVTNATHVWSFFQGSTYDYACAGHPQQLVVPYAKQIEGRDVFIDNEIRSPDVPVTVDLNGDSVTGPLFLEFDVYRDLEQNALVFYKFNVRSRVAGCWKAWRSTGFVYFSASETWFRFENPLAALIDPGATDIEVAIGAVDMCGFWCGIYGNGQCHSQAPLIDNVRVVSVLDLVVTNTANAGAGSLRQAIIDANASPNLSGIAFNIPGDGPHTIMPSPALPPITTRVIIDGYTETGASPNTNPLWQGSNAVLMIELDGSLLAAGDGLSISGDTCVVRGLVVNDFPDRGIELDQAIRTRVEGCYVGTDVTGTSAHPNEYGVYLFGGNNCAVGGSIPSARNVISGNSNDGVVISVGNTHTVQGNLIGVNAAGTTSLGNTSTGIRISDSPNATLSDNVVSANGGPGVYLAMAITGNGGSQLVRNRIGTDISGNAPLGNATHGIQFSIPTGSGNPIVVGGSAANGNLIAHNAGNGIRVALPAPGQRATISYNTIHSNGRGVVVTAGASTILFNQIGPNGGIGLDLGNDGVTANDLDDIDTGPNGLQNYPVLTAATPMPNGTIRISGTLNSTPSLNHTVQFFRIAACDPLGNGEGEVFMGLASIVTDATGNRAFTVNGFQNLPGGTSITATANPTTQTGTSEFSACFIYLNTLIGTDIVSIPADEETGASPVTLVFDNVTGSGNVSLSTSDTGPPPPGAFTFGADPTFYDLSTTATYTGSIEVCFEYDEASVTGSEMELTLLHYDETLMPPSWVDITSSVDTLANVLCGTTTTLSPFAMAEPIPPTPVGDGPTAPAEFALHANAPNPFNPITTIQYDVPAGGAPVSIMVFDVSGRRVRTLVDESRPAGQHRVTWDGRNSTGQSVASGVYFYRMSAGSFVQTRKMVLLK